MVYGKGRHTDAARLEQATGENSSFPNDQGLEPLEINTFFSLPS